MRVCKCGKAERENDGFKGRQRKIKWISECEAKRQEKVRERERPKQTNTSRYGFVWIQNMNNLTMR